MNQAHWEHFPHEADMGVRGIGPTVEEAFAQVGLALTAVVTDVTQVRQSVAVPIQCAAPDSELLLADWLNALIYAMSTRKLVFGRYAVRITGHRLDATAWGEPVDPVRHQPAVEVKGATYTQLTVEQRPGGGWMVQCVVDV